MMEKVTLNIPSLYGDHHVLAVRDILGKISGVEDVYASSAFKQVAVTFDPAKTKPADFESALAAEGYAVGDAGQPQATIETPALRWKGGAQFVIASGLAESVRFSAPPVNYGAGGPRPCPGFEFRTFAGGQHPGDD
jgi:copper chaperone CopZ